MAICRRPRRPWGTRALIPPALDGYRATRILAGESGGTVDRFDAVGRGSFYLKQGEGEIAEAITDEMARLVWLRGRVAVPELVQFVRSPDMAWLLTTAMAGDTIDTLVEADPGCLAALLPSLAAFLRTLHALPIEQCPFNAGAPVRLAAARARLDAGVIDTGDFGDEHNGWTAYQVWDEMATLRPTVFERVVTHGDFSLGNLLVEAGRVTGMIDVGRVGVADPYQDLAILWHNLEEFGAGLGDRFLAEYDIDRPDRARLAFHLCLDEFF